ncbi:hypothetical protein SeLEV6574_g01516 [Synchytrium endobioticum]|uniref:Secreted protein n=1 Tax=Synchytrium endobioticum TaxID=286115 RepID=A0A507DER7_9FUNG|nr:hypothetical protein SeLEV6574_g01516 [Synchytrium endobioticum]
MLVLVLITLSALVLSSPLPVLIEDYVEVGDTHDTSSVPLPGNDGSSELVLWSPPSVTNDNAFSGGAPPVDIGVYSRYSRALRQRRYELSQKDLGPAQQLAEVFQWIDVGSSKPLEEVYEESLVPSILPTVIPYGVPFTETDVERNPTDEMSPEHLEYRWEAFENLLTTPDGHRNRHLRRVQDRQEEYTERIKAIACNAVFGSVNSPNQRGQADAASWPLAAVTDVLTLEKTRIDERIRYLQASKESPLSSLTQAAILSKAKVWTDYMSLPAGFDDSRHKDLLNVPMDCDDVDGLMDVLAYQQSFYGLVHAKSALIARAVARRLHHEAIKPPEAFEEFHLKNIQEGLAELVAYTSRERYADPALDVSDDLGKWRGNSVPPPFSASSDDLTTLAYLTDRDRADSLGVLDTRGSCDWIPKLENECASKRSKLE